MPVRFNPEFPLLTSMTGKGLLLVPTDCDEKTSRVGFAVSAGPFTPVPLRGMATGPVRVLSPTVIEPEFDPVLAGEKFTVMVQWAPASRLVPQSLVWLKFPLATILVILKVTLAGLLIVMVCGALTVPMPCEPKWREAGATALNGVLSSTATSFVDVLEAVPAIASGIPSWLRSTTAAVPAPRKAGMGRPKVPSP